MNSDQRRENNPPKRKAAKECDRVAEAVRPPMMSYTDVSIQREVAYILKRAIRRDCVVVVIGELVLFATASGDAWLLDADDQTAVCLARDGDSQGVRIVETPTQFAIEWDGTYTFDGGVFRVRHRSGKLSAITGYPLDEVQQAIARHTQLAGRTMRLASQKPPA